MRLPRPHLPKFSLADVLLLTTAAAGALAVSGEADSWSGLHVDQFFLFLGLFLCCGQLALHAVAMKRESTVSSSHTLHLRLALLTRWLVVVLSVSVGVIALLANRERITTDAFSEDAFNLVLDLWSEIIPFALAMVAISLLMVPPLPRGGRHPVIRWGTTLIVASSLIGYGLVILWERWTIGFLVHAATNGVELAQRGHLHRPGVFPNHVVEGYVSFWKTTAAAALWLVAAIVLIATPVRGSPWYRWGRFGFMLIAVIVVAGFDLWYYRVEFPRLSPDLATVNFCVSRWGAAGFAFLVVGLAHYGGMLVTRDPALQSVDNEPLALRRSPLLFLGGLSLVVGILVALGTMLRDLAQWLSGGPLQFLADFLVYLAVAPEFFLFLLLLPCVFKLLWQSFVRREITLILKPVQLTDYLCQFTLALALLLVGIPCLRALGFAMWIGPEWPFF
jgi:hypothetical protein